MFTYINTLQSLGMFDNDVPFPQSPQSLRLAQQSIKVNSLAAITQVSSVSV